MSVAIAPHEAFGRQADALVRAGFPALARLSDAAFEGLVAPLEAAALVAPGLEGRIPFALVLRGLPTAPAIERVVLDGRPGFTSMEPGDLARFAPIVELPACKAYLVTGVDTGRGLLGVTPDDAIATIEREGRSPLTLEEGLALVAQVPNVLEADRFSLLGSRCGDRRVPAIWVSERRARLGWCWSGAPHSWLGSASCAGRVAATV
jgi:Family of unknown function (DUF5701)